MKRSLIVLAALTAVTLCSNAAMAENREGALNLTPVIGGYHFDGTQRFDPNVLLGLKAGYNITDRLGIEALLHHVLERNSNNLSLVNYRAEFLYHFFPKSSFVPFLAAGGGGVRTSFNENNTTDNSGVISYGGGVKYALSDNVALRADARMLSVFYNPSIVYNYEYTLGLNFQLGGSGGSVAPVAVVAAPKASPAAPAPKPVEPAPAPKPVEPAPAPKPAPQPPPAAVVQKQAPVAPVVAPVPAPAPAAKLSADPVSIPKSNSSTLSWNAQNSTECSIMPGIGPVQPSGSMKVSPASTTTYKLACKGKGGAADSSATINVIQPPADSDNDGVTDDQDKCPNTPAGTKVESDGCPKIQCTSVTLSISFDTGKAEIKDKHHDDLRPVADRLQKFPKAMALIEGHTDNVGSSASNKKLSQRRADAVKQYLVDKVGITGNRISTKGFGDSKPIDSNKTDAGRKNNRRVEAVFTCPE